MSAQINIPPFLRHLVSDIEVADVNGSIVGECLNDLVRQFPQLRTKLFNRRGKLLNYLDVYVNGKSAYPEELAKPVNESDELHIVNIITGG